MKFNRWPVRNLLLALTCVALATAPGCGSEGEDDSPFVQGPGPGLDPGPGPDPDPDPEPDPGPGWEVQLSEGAGPLFSVRAVDADHAWALSFSQMFRTQDGGATWTNLGELSGNDIQFIDASNGWMIGSDNVLSTSDGGDSWTVRLTLPPTPEMWWSTMSFVSATTGWVAEYNAGAFFRTTDGGDTWTSLELPPGVMPILKFLDAQNGFARMKGDTGSRLFATTDGGESWEERLHVVSGSHLDKFDAVSMDVVWAGVRHNSGPPCDVLRTTDGGATWTVVALEGEGSQGIHSIEFVNATQGWIIGTHSTIYTTSDGGATWTVQESPAIPGGPYNYHGYSDIVFVNETTGWIVGSVGNTISGGKGIMLSTTSGGD